MLHTLLYIGVLLGGIERWAGFGGIVFMAMDGGIGKLRPELSKEREQRRLLRCGACVLGCLAVGGETTDIADADGVGIVTFAVCANLFERSARVDAAVKVNHIVVADAVETTLAVPAVDVGDGERLVLGGGGTMDDDVVYFAHEFRDELRVKRDEKGRTTRFFLTTNITN